MNLLDGMGVRPEDFEFAEGEWRGEVVLVENLGAERLVHVRCRDQRLVVRASRPEVSVGQTVGLRARRIHRFGPDGKRREDP